MSGEEFSQNIPNFFPKGKAFMLKARKMARPARFERATAWFVASRSSCNLLFLL